MSDDDSIPVAREEVTVGKERKETGRVTVHTHVREEVRPVEVDLAEERVEIRRIPAERFVDGPVPDRREGDTLVVSVLEEVLVVEKRLKVVEEIHITRVTSHHAHREEHHLRREEVEIERSGGGT
ncbi:YsnF/AvaK domain-containing protein [Telmatospirillum sp. J64-1]|uniref:YsnF/AvaK domain-containing protein n=1 Tax=Telmatospirillum sp. J64-1 TaxID=2502183 RepID=UPI00115CE51D|nr:DUF2382 domain-containing protein [Telmatospirillum sp. J64-1]